MDAEVLGEAQAGRGVARLLRQKALCGLPGMTVAILATVAAMYLSDHYGPPLTFMALLIGLSLNFLNTDERLLPGLQICSGLLLRLSIVLIGARITFGQIASLGFATAATIIVIVTGTLLAGLLAARLANKSSAFGILAGGAVAICGASAATALFATLGERKVSRAELSVVLVAISALSPLAMIFYPTIAHSLGFDDRHAGFIAGAAIHDVAQSLGAGYSISTEGGDTATIVKLGRVMLLAPLLLTVALVSRDDRAVKAPILPWFVGGFLLLMMANSLVTLPQALRDAAAGLTGSLLACAVTATAIQARLHSLRRDAFKSVMIVLFATLVSFALSIMAAIALI